MNSLTAERWRQVQDVLNEFDDLPTSEKSLFLEATRRNDPELYRLVESFLEKDDHLDKFLERPLFPICSENIDDGILAPRIGAYRLARELGEGGMGTVYLAHQEEPFKRRVALKLIRREILRPEVVQRFEAERQILAGIRHPNVAQLYAGGTASDGRPYFVMEYVEGKPIEEYCDVNRLGTRKRLALFLEVCSAVHLAHQKLRVVHRDLKPGNILVTDEGVPKLLDFGIAKSLDSEMNSIADVNLLDGERVDETHQPTSVWTPFYSSPEQLAGLPLTTASDIYSLGVLLYRLLAGRLPYRVESTEPDAVRAAIEEQVPIAPSVAVSQTESRVENGTSIRLTPEEVSRVRDGSLAKLRRQLAGDLDAIVLKAIAKKPEDRFASVEQFAADIRHYIDGRPVKARESTPMYRAGKFVRRNWPRLAVAAVVTLLVIGLIGEQAREIAQVRRVSSSLVDLLKALQPVTPDQRVELEEALAKATLLVDDPMFASQPLNQALLMDAIGRAYTSLGLYEQAETLLERALEIRREKLGSEHLLVAQSFHNLAFLDQHTGEITRAEKRLRQSLKIRYANSEPDASELAEGINTLAILLYEQGYYAEAQALFSRVVAMRTRRYDDGHPSVIQARNNLATTLVEQGHYDAAEEVYRRNLEIRLSRLKWDHKDVANSRNQLATVLFAQGRFDAAVKQAREALRVRVEVYGADHRNVALVLNNLGKVLHGQGNLDDAEAASRRALAIYNQQLVPDYYLAALTKTSLAATLIAKGDGEEAATLARSAMETLISSQNAESWRIADAESVYAASLVQKGRYSEAEESLKQSFEIIRTARGESAPYTRDAARRLVELYEAWGKPDLAEMYRRLVDGSKSEGRGLGSRDRVRLPDISPLGS